MNENTKCRFGARYVSRLAGVKVETYGDSQMHPLTAKYAEHIVKPPPPAIFSGFGSKHAYNYGVTIEGIQASVVASA